MINLQVHQLRRPSETDHCECGNLLREKSLEFVLVKNKNLSIYSYQRKRKKNHLIYETKLNAPVVKVVILKDVFLRKNKERISGVLLVYKGMHFVLYRFNRHLNTLVVVLKHSFVKKAKFQPIFYSLPIAVNYVHRYDKGGGSASGRTIRIGGRKPITGITRRRRFRLATKRLKGYMPGLHPGLLQGEGLPEQELSMKTRKGKGRRRKATPVGEPSELTKSELNSQNGVNDEIYVNIYGERGRGANLEEPFWMDQPVTEDFNIGSAEQPPGILQNGQTKMKKRTSNFCEFVVSFSYDFKTIYVLFYSSRRKRKNGLDPTYAGEMRTTYFGKDLYLFNIVKVSLQDLYRHFIFIKKIFFHGGNIHVLLQNEPINVGHATLEELSLKLLILRQEDHKFDANKLMKGFPNDTIDVLRVKDLFICLCQDYLYILNVKKNQKVIYMFKKSCYTNRVLHLQKKEALFCDCTGFSVHFKESSSNMCYRKGKLFILTRRYILEGTLSRDHNNLVKLIKWRKAYTFKYDLAKSSVYFFGGRFYFVCCYNGLCGRADVDLLVRRREERSRGRCSIGGGRGEASRKRKAALPAHPAKREKLQKGEKGERRDGGTPPSGEVPLHIDSLAANGDPQIAPLPRITTCGDSPRATRKVRTNNNFLMDLLIYLNKNPTVNEHTKGLNHSKYHFLFQKYKKKIKILEGNFSLINAQGGVEYVPPLFILRRRKGGKRKAEKRENREKRDKQKAEKQKAEKREKQKGGEEIGTPLPLGNMTRKKEVTLVDKIPAKGMLTDLIKSSEEPSLVNNSSYFALIGNKKHSSVVKIFFKVPFSTLLNVSFAGACTRSVCANEGGRRNGLCQYVMINLEGGKHEQGGEDGAQAQNERKDERSYGDEQSNSEGGGNGFIRRSILLCVDNLNTWRQKKEIIKKMTFLNEKKEGVVDEPTKSRLPFSDVGDQPRGTLLNNHRAKVIYTLRGDGVQGEPSHEVEFPPTGTAKVETLRAFFRFYPFVHYSNRDVKRYVERVPYCGEEPSLHGGNQSEALPKEGESERESIPQIERENQSSRRSTPPQRSKRDIEIELKQKYAQFFHMERKKNTSLSMEGNCIALLRFKCLLVQVCQKEINVSLYANTCMVLRTISVKDSVVECKLARRFLILRHESGSCSVYTFHIDEVTDLLLRVEELTSLLNMCVLRCLDVENRDQEINLLQFATFLRDRAVKGGEPPSPWNSSDIREEDLLSLFRTKTSHTFFQVVNRMMGGSDVGEILSLYTQLDNVRCISTVKRGKQSLLAFLDDSNCTLRIFHLEKRRTLFVSNALLAVPKYVYNEKLANRTKWANRANRAKITAEGGEAPRGELLLDTYKLEEVINVLLFPLGPNYVLILFLTGRPILIYKSVREVRRISRLKFQIVTHRYTQPLLSNVHLVKDPSGEKMQVVTVSRDKAEMNNGFVLHVDGRKRGKGTKADKVRLQIMGYPHVDISKVDLSHVSGSQKEQLYQKVGAYDAAFPPLLLSNCRGKLFVHRCGGEEGEPKQGQPKGIVKIDRNAFLRIDATGLRIVSIEEEEKVCAAGPDRAGLHDRAGRHDRGQRESQLNRDVARTLSEASPPLEVTCHHSNVDMVEAHNEVFLVRSPPPNILSFNDDFVSKLFLSYPYMYKIAVSKFEYVLKRGKGRQKEAQRRGEKEGEHGGEKVGEREGEKVGERGGEHGANKPTADPEEKANQPAPAKQQGEPPERDDPPPVHTATRGKVICAIVRIKYDEYHCLKKLQKRRLNLQKEELQTNGFPNGGLDSALQSIILSRGGDIKHSGKYSGRSQHGELLSGEDEVVPYSHDRSITSRRANQKSTNIDPNVHCNILHCINSKLFIHEVSERDFTKGAFLDNNFFITDIKIVNNFFIVADLHRGIYINMYNYEQQHDSRSIIPIAKSFFSSNLNILCCHYLVMDCFMCILAMDIYNNFFIFSFRSYQSVDILYVFDFFNFSRRVIKYVNSVHPDRRSNSALSISNDGSVHLFHPIRSKSFAFFRETYNVVRTSLFPHLALNAHADLSPDVFTQSARLNLHKKTDSFSIKNVLFDDMLRVPITINVATSISTTATLAFE
ncbi:hypothetical protein PCYB_102840 [Plasmodium cynomolgi strain B]|uniref:RSE1/DDB1/CPSF1 C-terminal domain-containing protein n=1 Tax=Plasmodium cynomolgi (strain B) TaxID=1120755 RepID=K6UU74_PLACD|nr:hypothetical protein PCYB_102840 [Plasmodium cynomolgi strain B]GAB66934.1 hypothetical protein PCYB_102840 [Plasmodium cynomolgi strain B]